jgi:hypothetical protein
MRGHGRYGSAHSWTARTAASSLTSGRCRGAGNRHPRRRPGRDRRPPLSAARPATEATRQPPSQGRRRSRAAVRYGKPQPQPARSCPPSSSERSISSRSAAREFELLAQPPRSWSSKGLPRRRTRRRTLSAAARPSPMRSIANRSSGLVRGPEDVIRAGGALRRRQARPSCRAR